MGAYYWSPGMTIAHMEETFVAEALHFYNGSEQSAANSLGISLEQFKAIIKRSQLAKDEQDKQDAERKKSSAEFLARSRGVIGVDKTGHDTMSPYVPAEGINETDAVQVLALSAPGAVTPESAIPAVAVLPNAGDPLAAAKLTKKLMKENVPVEQNFPKED